MDLYREVWRTKTLRAEMKSTIVVSLTPEINDPHSGDFATKKIRGLCFEPKTFLLLSRKGYI